MRRRAVALTDLRSEVDQRSKSFSDHFGRRPESKATRGNRAPKFRARCGRLRESGVATRNQKT